MEIEYNRRKENIAELIRNFKDHRLEVRQLDFSVAHLEQNSIVEDACHRSPRAASRDGLQQCFSVLVN